MLPIIGLEAAKPNIHACSRNQTPLVQFSHYTASEIPISYNSGTVVQEKAIKIMTQPSFNQ
jgi:hypothetical protein